MQRIIINSIPQEIRIAIMEEDRLAELYIEGKRNRRIVGDIFKGCVTKVLPGIEAAFVDIGLPKDAFLYVLDVFDNLNAIESSVEGVDSGDDSLGEIEGEGLIRDIAAPPIQEILREGQEILVQVAKEALGTKGARVTSHINLPGRNLVFMPTVKHVGVSRRIQDEAERERLRELVENLRNDTGGYIVRTVGENKGEDEFQADIRVLQTLWHQIQEHAEQVKAPSVVYEDFDPIYRAIRDFFHPEVERIIVDSEDDYQRCVELLNAIDPSFSNRVRLHVKETPIFEYYGIETAIDQARRRKVWLRSGGYLVIDQTEALVVIDVNTGKYVGRKNLEETITLTNVEAAKEIARQVRLRNLGGIIIIDFIDMELKENRDLVLKTLEDAFKSDRARTNIFPFTKLSLVEMTRKRVRKSLIRTLSEPCTYCGGEGYIKSSATVSFEIFRQLQQELERSEFREIIIRVHPDVAFYLRTEEHQYIMELQEQFGKTITLQSDLSLHREQFDIMTT